MFVEIMPDQMYFETDVLMDLNPKSVPRNTARSKFVDDGRSTRGIGLRRFGEKSACPTLLVRVMIVWKERRKTIIVDETDRCWERRDPYYRSYTKM
jgi:hypothetical protein